MCGGPGEPQADHGPVAHAPFVAEECFQPWRRFLHFITCPGRPALLACALSKALD